MRNAGGMAEEQEHHNDALDNAVPEYVEPTPFDILEKNFDGLSERVSNLEDSIEWRKAGESTLCIRVDALENHNDALNDRIGRNESRIDGLSRLFGNSDERIRNVEKKLCITNYVRDGSGNLHIGDPAPAPPSPLCLDRNGTELFEGDEVLYVLPANAPKSHFHQVFAGVLVGFGDGFLTLLVDSRIPPVHQDASNIILYKRKGEQ